MRCDIELNPVIEITTRPMPLGRTIAQTYGHEQQHIESMIIESHKIAASHESETDDCKYSSASACNKAADKLALKIYEELAAKVAAEKAHDRSKNPNAPSKTGNYNPIGQVPPPTYGPEPLGGK